MELSEGEGEFLAVSVEEPEVLVEKGPISPIRAPSQSSARDPSPVPSLQSAQIPPQVVDSPEEAAEVPVGVYSRTGEWVAGVVPPPPPLLFL